MLDVIDVTNGYEYGTHVAMVDPSVFFVVKSRVCGDSKPKKRHRVQERCITGRLRDIRIIEAKIWKRCRSAVIEYLLSFCYDMYYT